MAQMATAEEAAKYRLAVYKDAFMGYGTRSEQRYHEGLSRRWGLYYEEMVDLGWFEVQPTESYMLATFNGFLRDIRRPVVVTKAGRTAAYKMGVML